MSVHSSFHPQLTLRKRVCFKVGRSIAIDHEKRWNGFARPRVEAIAGVATGFTMRSQLWVWV